MDGGRLAKRLVFIASNFVEDVLSKAEKIHRNYLLEQMIDVSLSVVILESD